MCEWGGVEVLVILMVLAAHFGSWLNPLSLQGLGFSLRSLGESPGGYPIEIACSKVSHGSFCWMGLFWFQGKRHE